MNDELSRVRNRYICLEAAPSESASRQARSFSMKLQFPLEWCAFWPFCGTFLYLILLRRIIFPVSLRMGLVMRRLDAPSLTSTSAHCLSLHSGKEGRWKVSCRLCITHCSNLPCALLLLKQLYERNSSMLACVIGRRFACMAV